MTTRPGRPRLTAELKALRVLDSSSLSSARRRASEVLSEALRCERCAKLLGHVFDTLGSTLFLDDDPSALACAFDGNERDADAPRVLAACIVLSGRQRVRVTLSGSGC